MRFIHVTKSPSKIFTHNFTHDFMIETESRIFTIGDMDKFQACSFTSKNSFQFFTTYIFLG